MADMLGLPLSMEAVICTDEAALEKALPTADFLVTEREPVTRKHIAGRSEAAAPDSEVRARLREHRRESRSGTGRAGSEPDPL